MSVVDIWPEVQIHVVVPPSLQIPFQNFPCFELKFDNDF